MLPRFVPSLVSFLLLSTLPGLVACKDRSAVGEAGGSTSLTLAAYSVPREAFHEAILPAYVAQRKKEGVAVQVSESYLASGAQSRAVASGFEADIVALSLEPDVERLVDTGLVARNWNTTSGGIISRSVVVIAFRAGNPKGIRGWEDLVRPDVEVLTPNPKTSGGAMWNILAAVGAVRRGHVSGYPASEQGALEYLSALLRNVRIMDRSGRESMITFERGTGDAIITYENEVLFARKQGQKCDYIIPRSTILIENPAALVDQVVDKHGVRSEAEKFLTFLLADEAQRAFADHGFRPVSENVFKEKAALFSPVHDQFSIADLGGWKLVKNNIFGEKGLFSRSLERAQAK